MKRIFVFLFVSFLLSVSGACAGGAVTRENAAQPSPSAVAQESPRPEDAELQKQIESLAAAAKGKVGVAAEVLESKDEGGGMRDENEPTGGAATTEATTTNAAASSVKQQFLVSLNSRDHFPMQSVYKLPIGMAVMKQVDAGKIKLDQKVRITKDDFIGTSSHSPIRDKFPNGTELTVNDLMGWMLKESDGTASDVLMKLAGGPEAVQAYLGELKITDMIVRDTEKAFAQDHSLQYRNWATPEAAVALLRALYAGRALSEERTAFVLKLMTESNTGPKRLKGLLPAGTVVAHKTGTSGTDNGVTAATNDIGIITLPDGRHLAIAVFVAESPTDVATREEVIAKIARAVWNAVSPQAGEGRK